MSKKRRENQEQKKPFAWRPMHYVIAAGVVVAFAVAAIVVFTLVVGTDFGKKKPGIDDIPKAGSETPAERSSAADILADKSWDDMTADDRALLKSEVNRAFDDGNFRASNALVLAADIFRKGGKTKVSRLYQLLKDPTPNLKYAESLLFYCPQSDGQVHAYKYFTIPDGTTLTDAVQEAGAQPWDIVVSTIPWENGVTDLGFDSVDGHRVHGFRVTFKSKLPSGEFKDSLTDYWWDVETARLLARGDYNPDKDSKPTRYTLRWRALPPIQIAADQDRPDCINDLYAQFTQ